MERVQRLVALSNDQLVGVVTALAVSERRAIGLLVAALAELDSRRLYLDLGYSSLFDYCTRALHLSEQAAYGRIEAARASRRFPIIIDLLIEGALSLTATRLLAPHLTQDNQHAVLEQARHKKTREVELIVATLRPLPRVPSTVRRLPEPHRRGRGDEGESTVSSASPLLAAASQVGERPPASRQSLVRPLSQTTYRLQVTLSEAGYEKLREAQALSRHAIPNGDPAVIVERALDSLLRLLRRTKFAATARPRPDSGSPPQGRHIPSAVKRAVWARDGGRCRFVGTGGVRCEAREFLEFHHVKPYARGGEATKSNLELRCRAHNAREAELEFA